ncbi:hypothetical protein MP969_25795, partial [Escherichia coli]|nr:hypothetical protein [Escherichia coli]
DLNAGTRQIGYVPLSPKAWRGLNIDASNDRQILLRNYPIHSFYQPADIVNFKFNGETYLATADAGFIERLSLVDDDCEFEEAIPGHQWINSQAFGTGLTQEEQNLLRAALSDPSNLGNTLFSKVRASTDGYNPITQGYDRIMAYGGRGMSILKVSTGERIYDSGDLFERVFTGSGFSPAYQAVFNAEVGSFSMPQSERFDTMSTTFGGRPSVIEVGHMQDVNKTVIVVANSYVGGLYYFELDLSGPEPLPVYQGYYRRGNPGISWLEAYNRGEDVGEPDTRDIQCIAK